VSSAFPPLNGSGQKTAYLVFDTESIPDGRLIARVRHAGTPVTPEEAVALAQEEARADSGSDFLPVCFQLPVAVCVARVGADFRLQAIRCLDAPRYRPAEIVKAFWQGVGHYQARLVSFNGRGFDLPLLEVAAFRYGYSAPGYFGARAPARHRYGDGHLDLLEFLTNFTAVRPKGYKLDVFAKLLGKPGKAEIAGHQVYDYYRQGKVDLINEYCAFDVLDTYFIFLRTRVMTGELTLAAEQSLVREAKEWVRAQAAEQPFLLRYLDRWGDWEPWP
jgi:hypothetical protein